MSNHDEILTAARVYLLKDSPRRVRALLSQATFDLWHGPHPAEDAEDDPNPETRYPGFSSACDELSDWFADAPSTVYVFEDCGNVSETKPEDTPECWECEGAGVAPTATDEDGDIADPDESCNTCSGRGWVEGESYYEFDARDALGGKLAEYLR
jgi:hypothetical protein